MNKPFILEWQAPFVDIFKTYDVFNKQNHEARGNVEGLQDNYIGRKVFRVTGKVPATNYVTIPHSKSQIKCLGANGRYIYVELCTQGKQLFLIHLDFYIIERNPVRFTISNMYDEYKTTSSGTLHIPYSNDNANRWTILCIDIEDHLKNYGLFPPNSVRDFAKIHILKSITICSNVLVRGIYTSDNLYHYKTLPREMDFRQPKDGKWTKAYQFLYYPPVDESRFKLAEKEIKASKDKEIVSKKGDRSSSPQPRRVVKGENKENEPQKSVPLEIADSGKKSTTGDKFQTLPWLKNTAEFTNTFVEQKHKSLLNLAHCFSFSGRRCPDIRWALHESSNYEILFAAGSILVATDADQGSQRFFTGHDSAICALDLAKDGSWVATAQEDNVAYVKVWDFESARPIGTILYPFTAISCLSFSHNKKLLCVTGTDSHKREIITIWNIENISLGKKPELVAKQVSEFNILSCKFSPLEADKLVSCGRENIRFWRIKGDHLAGGAVVLNHHARETVFTVLEYEFATENPTTALQNDTSKRVFIGSREGLLFQVNYYTRELEGVFKIHDKAICSIAVSAGFCVTGSEDQYLRVWPLDFTEYFLEAKHEGIVISLGISQDSLRVACGISSGGLGILDLSSQSYKTIMRSHTQKIFQIINHHPTGNLITLSEDLTIRIWDPKKLEQVYEFTYSKEDPCLAITAHPTESFFAAGFRSGILRIFDIDKTCICEEVKYHNAAIKTLSYSVDGKYLVSGDALSNYNLYDVERNLQPVKVFEPEIEPETILAAFTNDGKTLVTVGSYGTNLNFWDLSNFTKRCKLQLKNGYAKTLEFSQDDHELFIGTSDGKIKVYGVKNNDVSLLKEVAPIPKQDLTCLNVTSQNQYVATGGVDGVIRVWDLKSAPGEPNYGYVTPGHIQPLGSVTFSTDNSILFSGAGEEGIYVWFFQGDTEGQKEDFGSQGSFSSIIPIRHHVKKDFLQRSIDMLREREEAKQAELLEEGQFTFSGKKDDIMVEGEEGSAKKKQLTVFKPPIPRKNMKFRVLPQAQRSPPQKKSELTKAPETYRYIKTAERETNKLPFSHYALEADSREVEKKMKAINSRKSNLQLEYIVGFENDGHSNLVWHPSGGWFAYIFENYVVVEQLQSERKQKVILFNDYLSTIALSPNGDTMAVSAACFDSNIQANIYIIDCYSFKVTKTLKFHVKGVQAMQFSEVGNYLVSVSNFKESTVAVWDYVNGNLLSTSYTVNKINGLKIKEKTSAEFQLEFITAGGDQVILWSLKRDNELIHSDIFVKPKKGISIEISAVDLVEKDKRIYAFCGTTDGELIMVDLNTFEVDSRFQLTNQEIIQIFANNLTRKALITSIDAKIYHWDYNIKRVKIKDENAPEAVFKLECPVTTLTLDDESTEGLAGLMDGGIAYLNFKEKLLTKLVGAPSHDNPIVKVRSINDEIFATIHSLGGIKLWGTTTGEELTNYYFSGLNCTDLIFDESRNRIITFFDKDQVKILSIDDFTSVKTLQEVEAFSQPGEKADYVIQSVKAEEDEDAFFYFTLTNNGLLYTTQFSENDEVNFIEVFEQDKKDASGAFLSVSNTFKTLAIAYNDAFVQIFRYKRGSDLYPSLYLLDEWQMMDDPHGELGQKEDILSRFNREVYGKVVKRDYKVKLAFSETEEGVMVGINNYLQYALVRNYMTGEVLKRIPLNKFPTTLNWNTLDLGFVVGNEDGTVNFFDNDGEQTQELQTHFNGSIIHVSISKTLNNYTFYARKGFTIMKPAAY